MSEDPYEESRREDARREQFWADENSVEDEQLRAQAQSRYEQARADGNQMGMYAALGLTPPSDVTFESSNSDIGTPSVPSSDAWERYQDQRRDVETSRDLLLDEIRARQSLSSIAPMDRDYLGFISTLIATVDAESVKDMRGLERMGNYWAAKFGSSFSNSLGLFINASRLLQLFANDLRKSG